MDANKKNDNTTHFQFAPIRVISGQKFSQEIYA